jgi:hypothetical protein
LLANRWRIEITRTAKKRIIRLERPAQKAIQLLPARTPGELR